MFEACETGHPDTHNYLVPICDECHSWEKHWFHDEENPDRHDFKTPTGPLVWGENAHKENKCPKIEYDDTTQEITHTCYCPCHWGIYYVNVYEADRNYGGPEEGGWWYDTGTPIASTPFDTYAEAESYRDVIKLKYPYTRKRGNVNGGEDYDVIIQKHFAREFPEETPRWE